MMQAPDLTPGKIEELRGEARARLTPLIDADYVLVDLPYHDNLGDMLIWAGELQFLKELPHRCLYATGKDFYVSPHLKPEHVILLHGGGNWGDLWPEHHEFRKRVIEEFPDNRVIVMPQSVHYSDEANLRADAEFFSKHCNVVICVRDRHSQQILESALPNQILLVPDMAFFLDAHSLRELVNGSGEKTGRVLFANRLDKEAAKGLDLSVLPENAETHDWPTLEKPPLELERKLRHIRRFYRRLKRFTGLGNERKNVDKFYRNTVLAHHVATAVRFIDKYDEVWSTRLHVTILAMLLGKRVHVLDNAYNKTCNLLESWF